MRYRDGKSTANGTNGSDDFRKISLFTGPLGIDESKVAYQRTNSVEWISWRKESKSKARRRLAMVQCGMCGCERVLFNVNRCNEFFMLRRGFKRINWEFCSDEMVARCRWCRREYGERWRMWYREKNSDELLIRYTNKYVQLKWWK